MLAYLPCLQASVPGWLSSYLAKLELQFGAAGNPAVNKLLGKGDVSPYCAILHIGVPS